MDVEDLDKISDPNKMRKKISSIMQSYFKNRGNRLVAECVKFVLLIVMCRVVLV